MKPGGTRNLCRYTYETDQETSQQHCESTSSSHAREVDEAEGPALGVIDLVFGPPSHVGPALHAAYPGVGSGRMTWHTNYLNAEHTN